MSARSTAIVGQRGETIAVEYLRVIGYRIYACNVQLGHDEIDIVAHDPQDNVIVFVEVKARASRSGNYAPELNMTTVKKRRLRRAMDRWVTERHYEGGYRLDFIGVAAGAVCAHARELELPTE
jgi:putative endonuclease